MIFFIRNSSTKAEKFRDIDNGEKNQQNALLQKRKAELVNSDRLFTNMMYTTDKRTLLSGSQALPLVASGAWVLSFSPLSMLRNFSAFVEEF
jgi:hypothetical protein